MWRIKHAESVKQLGLGFAPVNLRPRSSAGKEWIASCNGIKVSWDCAYMRGKMKREADRWIRAASAEGQALCLPVNLCSSPHL